MANDRDEGWWGDDDADDQETGGWWSDEPPLDRPRGREAAVSRAAGGPRPNQSRGGFAVDGGFRNSSGGPGGGMSGRTSGAGRGGYREQARYEGGELGSSDWNERSFGRNGSAGFGDRAGGGVPDGRPSRDPALRGRVNGVAHADASRDDDRNQFGDDGRGTIDDPHGASRFRQNAYGDYNRGDYARATYGNATRDRGALGGSLGPRERGDRGTSRGASERYGFGGNYDAAGGSDDVERNPSHGRSNEAGTFGPEQQRPSFRGRGPKNYQRSDDRIRDDVSERLMDDHDVDASEVEVAVAAGVVTLTGMVADRAMKRRAEDLADRVIGVKDVHNNVRIHRAGNRGASPEVDGGTPSESKS